MDLPPNLKARSLNIDSGTIVDGRYEIVSCLGQGGMGTVYKAFDRLKEKFVAIKIISHEDQENHKHVLRFKREAEATARLNHPAITKLLDFGLIDGVQPYLVMEFIEGKTLSALIAEKGQLPLADTLSIFTAVCDGLTHAHENKVLHRDLKPSNIMINHDSDTTTVKILDFGIAKILESAGAPSVHITNTGELLGSPFYMSPEQAKGGRIDHRSDLYSLGCTIYEALTGGPPHMGENPMSTLLKRESHEALPMAEASLGRKFPEQLENIVAKLLKHDPAERYQSACDLKHDLLKVGEQSDSASTTKEATLSPKQSNSSPVSQTHKNPKYVLTMAAVLLLVVACSASIAFLTLHEQNPSVRTAPEPQAVPPKEEEYKGQLNRAAFAYTARSAKSQASKFRNEGKYELAEKIYVQTLREAATAPGDNNEIIAILHQELAWTYVLHRQVNNALKEYDQAREYYEKSFDVNDPRLAKAYLKLAGVYGKIEPLCSHAALTRGAELYDKASKYYERHLPQTSKDLDLCLSREAPLLNRLSNHEARKRVLIKLLGLRTSECGINHPETLDALARLAECCRALNEYDEASTYDKKWLAAYDNSPDEPQPDRVDALQALSYDYYNLGKPSNVSMLKSAEKLTTRAVKLCQRDPLLLKQETPIVLELHGAIYKLLGRVDKANLEQAEHFSLQAVKAFERLPNTDKGRVPTLLREVADTQLARGHFADATATSLEVLKMRTKIFGANSLEVLDVLWILANAYKDQGKLSESTTYFERILALSKRYYGADSSATGDALAYLAENAKLQGNYTKARPLLVNCLSVFRHSLGPTNPKTIWAQDTLKAVDGCLKTSTNAEPARTENSKH